MYQMSAALLPVRLNSAALGSAVVGLLACSGWIACVWCSVVHGYIHFLVTSSAAADLQGACV